MKLSAILSLFLAASGAAGGEESLRIVAFDESGREVRSAAGVVLEKGGYVVTSRGVLVGARRLEVVTPGGVRTPVRWIAAEDPGAGLVKLWTGGQAEAPSLDRGEDPQVRSILSLSGRTMPVRKVRDVPGSGVVAELDATAEYSQAGAPLLDDRRRVAGVLVPQFLGTRNVAFCVPVSHALDLGYQPLRTVEEWSAAHDRAAEEAYQLALGQIWGEYYDNAAHNLLEAVTAKPDFAEAWFHLGYAHAKLGHVSEKIRYYRRAIALKPDYAEAHFSLGFSLLLQGKRDEARQEVETLRKISAPALADKLAEMVESVHIDVLGKHDDDVI